MSRRAATEGIEVARKLEALPGAGREGRGRRAEPRAGRARRSRWPRPPRQRRPTRRLGRHRPGHGGGHAAAAGGQGPPAGCGRSRHGPCGAHVRGVDRRAGAAVQGLGPRRRRRPPVEGHRTGHARTRQGEPARPRANARPTAWSPSPRSRVAADADPDRATVVAIVELAAICDDDPAPPPSSRPANRSPPRPPGAWCATRGCRCSSRTATGRAVGVGTTARTVGPALRRALMVRDGHCRFGDCTARRFLHAHHITHWPAPTVHVEPGDGLLLPPPLAARRRLEPHRRPLRRAHRRPPRRPTKPAQPPPDGRRHRTRRPPTRQAGRTRPDRASARQEQHRGRGTSDTGVGADAGAASEPSLFEDTG